MAIPWGILTFVIGIVYGAIKAGKQDKSALFVQGLIIGVILAIVLIVIGIVTNSPALGVAGALGMIIAAVVLSLLFVLGVWIGDLITGSRRRHVV
jgi:hypothetical protein